MKFKNLKNFYKDLKNPMRRSVSFFKDKNFKKPIWKSAPKLTDKVLVRFPQRMFEIKDVTSFTGISYEEECVKIQTF